MKSTVKALRIYIFWCSYLLFLIVSDRNKAMIKNKSTEPNLGLSIRNKNQEHCFALRILHFSFAYTHRRCIPMTDEQKSKIISMRESGKTYADIAACLNLSLNTVKSFYRRNQTLCKCCGTPITQPTRARKKIFCSDKCRMKWWNSHQEDVSRKAVYDFICECCGTAFQAYGNNHRKYCSRSCYTKARYGSDE